VFCALGTTRSQAGSAENFRKVDLTFVSNAAKVSKESGVSEFSLVSAQGANAGLWSSDFKPFHGFLYSKTKGMAENAVKQQGFKYSTIMRPGLLDRQESARWIEKSFSKIIPSVSCAQVAKVMIAEAERNAASTNDVGAPKVTVWNMSEIQKGRMKQ